MRISERELECLKVLGEGQKEYYDEEKDWTSFKYVAKKTKLSFSQARRAVRSLARKELAMYDRLFDEDGFAAGSGYHITQEGCELLWKKN